MFPSSKLAEDYAFTLPRGKRDYALVCKRGSGWVVVDASANGPECFLAFVNDPHGHRGKYSNTYFDDDGSLHVKSNVPARMVVQYDLHLPHEANAKAELLCMYRPENDFFIP